MKLLKKTMTILLSVAIMTSCMSFGAFAEGEEPSNNVQVSVNSETNSLDLSWAAVEGASYYSIDVYDNEVLIKSLSHIEGTSVSISDIDTDGSYTYDLKAFDAEDEPMLAGVPFVTPAAPQKLEVVRGRYTFKVRWAASEGAAGYKVYVAETNGSSELPATLAPIDYDADETDTEAVIKDCEINTKYRVWVVAYGNAMDTTTYSAPSTIVGERVHGLYYKGKMKVTRTVYCHCDECEANPVKHTFKKNTVISTINGYGKGTYKFKYNGHEYWMALARMKSVVAYTNHADKYSKEEALYFINEVNPSSPTGYVVWASLYSQNVYVFQKVNGNWTVIDSCICASGKAATPTPTGFSKSIWKKMKSYHGRKYWSCFSSLNAFHGLKKEKLKGKPLSHGCVRLNTANCSFIYNNIPKNSTVISY